MLKEHRKEAGMSQAMLAEKTGVPLRTIQYWEAGHIKKAPVDKVKRVADVLGRSIEQLIY